LRNKAVLANNTLNEPIAARLSKSEYHLARGEAAKALGHAKAALELAPDHGPALHLTGLAAAAMGDPISAVAFLERAVASRPDSARWLADLGTAQYAAGRFEHSVETLSIAEGKLPDATTSMMAGHAFRKCGKPVDAVKAYRRALEIDPAIAVQFSLGCSLYEAGNLPEALVALTQYASKYPDNVEVARKLAYLCGRLRLHARAASYWRTVLALSPGDMAARHSLLFAMIQSDPPEETLAFGERILADGPRSRFLASTALMVRLHCAGQTRASIRCAHEEWASSYLGPPRSALCANERNATRPLRIGYIGGEFWFAPSYFFLFPIVSNHDRSDFDITLYDTLGREDEATAAYRASSGVLRKVHGCSPDELASRIRADRIDILVDLSGHYESQGLLVFAHRVAPIQVTYPNYPSTTGIAQIDYILSDRWVCPEGHEDQYTERVHRLETGYLAYAPPSCAAGISRQTAEPRSVTFGIFQRATKFTSGFWDAVASILNKRVSRLLIHFGSAELDDPESTLRLRLAGELKKRGVTPDRVTFIGARPLEQHLRILTEADIALDTFPYNGQTTTCECLYMGVPVVTLVGDTHVSRVGWQILARAGLEHWAAPSVRGYVRLAIENTADKKALASSQRVVSTQFRNSPVLDGQALAREIESWYRKAWRRWTTCN
jgi:protein O-GlcNAc transferase